MWYCKKVYYCFPPSQKHKQVLQFQTYVGGFKSEYLFYAIAHFLGLFFKMSHNAIMVDHFYTDNKAKMACHDDTIWMGKGVLHKITVSYQVPVGDMDT